MPFHLVASTPLPLTVETEIHFDGNEPPAVALELKIFVSDGFLDEIDFSAWTDDELNAAAHNRTTPEELQTYLLEGWLTSQIEIRTTRNHFQPTQLHF